MNLIIHINININILLILILIYKTLIHTHINTSIPLTVTQPAFFFFKCQNFGEKKILNNSQKIFFAKIFWLRDRGGVKDSFINEKKKKFRRGNPLRDLEKSENSKLSETHF